MRNKIQNTIIFSFFAISNIMLSQGPNPDDAGGGVNPTDAPIDANIFLLAVFAVILAYFIFFKNIIPRCSK